MKPIVFLGLSTIAGMALLLLLAAHRFWNDSHSLAGLWTWSPVMGAILALLVTVTVLGLKVRVEYLSGPRSVSRPDAFVNVLRPLSETAPRPQISIDYQPLYDGTARALAEELARLFRSARWDVVGPSEHEVNEGPFQGIRFVQYAGARTAEHQERHVRLTAAVIDVLELLDEPCQIFPNGSRDDSKAGNIVVGPRPIQRPKEGKKIVRMPDESSRFRREP